MGTAQIHRRRERLDRAMHPPANDCITLEQMCRQIWRHDKVRFRKLAAKSNLAHFIKQFEYEDTERAGADRGRGR